MNIGGLGQCCVLCNRAKNSWQGLQFMQLLKSHPRSYVADAGLVLTRVAYQWVDHSHGEEHSYQREQLQRGGFTTGMQRGSILAHHNPHQT